MKSTESLLLKVDRALESLSIGAGARVLVGCSGGPDSTALLAALRELAGSRGLSVAAAYLDHGIRASAERAAELELVRATCRRLDVALSTRALAPGFLVRRARGRGLGLEECARAARLSWLRREARRQGRAFVALGHTADDQAETLIMRFFQGSGARGLGGIRLESKGVIRPLLECSRDEVLAFLGRRGLPFHSDSTNADRRFLRNRVRAELAPLIEDVFPGHRSALRALAAKMTALADLAEGEMDRRDVWSEEGGGRFCADAAALAALPAALQAESVYRVIDRLSRHRRRMPYRPVEEILRACSSGRDAELVAGGVRLRLRNGRLTAGRDIVCPSKTGYFRVLEPIVSPEGSSRPSTRTRVVVSGKRFGAVTISAAGVRPPVVVRSRRRGDRLRTTAGTKSLKELLIQWAVPLEARDEAAVVADARGVLAVVALPWGARGADRKGLGAGGPVDVAAMTENGAECAEQ